MATVDKNFRIKHGLVIEGSTATLNGNNILSEDAGDSYILNLVGGATLVKSVDTGVFNVDGAGNLTVNANTFDSYGSASAAQTAAEAAASADATTKAANAKSEAISAAATDATTKVAAEAALRVSGDAASVSTAAADATTKADAAQAAAISAAAADATTKANAAKAGAEATAAAALSSAISTEVTNRNTAISTAVDNLVDGAPNLLNTLNELAAAINDDANYTTTITTALGTKANAADVTTSLAGKQDTLAAGSNIDITGSTISVTGLDTDDVAEGTNLYFTNQRAIDAVGGSATSDNTPDTVVKRDGSGNFAANTITASRVTYGEAGYVEDDASLIITATNSDLRLNAADDIRMYAQDDITLESVSGQITLDVPNGEAFIGINDAENKIATVGYVDQEKAAAETTAQAALDNALNGTTAFTEINVNSEAKQIAATSSSLGSVVVTAYEWPKADYRSGKFLVKIDNGTHNEISEILVTLDSSDNIAITEYAIVGTNGSRGTITATVSGANVQLRVDPVNDSTIKVSGTLLK